MPDLLVRLYALPGVTSAPDGVVVRRALAPERPAVTGWVRRHWTEGWAAEVDTAFSRTPTTCLVALRDRAILGFAVWDAVALGFFGPTGVDPAARRQGIGAALLHAALRAMAGQGYAYAVIGGVDPAAASFYARTAGAIDIPDSTPGIYAGLLKP